MKSTLSAARRSTCFTFLICGTGMASWAPMVPYAKSRLALSDAHLGLILLSLGAGALVAMPITGLWINRFGSRAVMLAGVLTLTALLPLLALAPSPLLLACALFVFGAGVGATDVAMNAQAVVIETQMARPIMSSFHALYSVGGLVGALGVSLLLEQGFTLVSCALAVSLTGMFVAFWQFPKLLPASADSPFTGSLLAFPRGPVIWLGTLAFIAFLAEGALLDWSAVFLHTFRDVPETQAGIGFAIFSITMTLGRFTGDWVTLKLGRVTTTRYGALLAAMGYGIAVAVPFTFAPMLGFALIGLGIANVVPLLFSAASRLESPPPSISIPALTTLGYAGLLSGPAIIGWIAQVTSLPLALSLVGASLLIIVVSARSMR